ncbi:MAG: hypothetical protein OXD29_07615, partial [Roseovarius sp.]|nr:hypothetical protein [Roseovarius sp.]
MSTGTAQVSSRSGLPFRIRQLAQCQQFPLEFLFVVLQWVRWIAENIFSWTFAAEIGHCDRKRQAREKTTGNSFRGHLSMP